MKVYQALKHKKKLAGDLQKLWLRLIRENKIIVGVERTYNIDAVKKQIDKITNELLQLKTDLYNANKPIQHKLYLLSELKGAISKVNSIDTTDGKYTDTYNNKEIVYDSFYKTIDKDKWIEELEQAIEETQDEIDQFNYTTDI